MANFVRSESVVRDAVNFCADSDVIEVSLDRATAYLFKREDTKIVTKIYQVPRCYYTRWGGDDSESGKEDLIILENLYSEVSE